MENSSGVFGHTNDILFVHVVANDLVFDDLAKAQQIHEPLLIPPAEVIGIIEAANHNISVISFHFILKFFKEGNPSANMLVFKGPSN